MIADMIDNKKLNSVVTDLFIRDRKLNISFVLITQSYFKVPKDVTLNTTHFFINEKSEQKRDSTNCTKSLSGINTKHFIRNIKNVLLNHILFWLMMLRLHQIIL